MLNDMGFLSLPALCAYRFLPAIKFFSRTPIRPRLPVGLPEGIQFHPRRIEAPTRGELRDFFKIHFRVQQRRRVIAVSEQLHVHLDFRQRLDALMPDGFARPRVGARHAAVVQPRPRVMMKQPARVKILHMAELPAQRREEKKRRIHVIRRIRQTHAGDDHPAVDARADEKIRVRPPALPPMNTAPRGSSPASASPPPAKTARIASQTSGRCKIAG